MSIIELDSPVGRLVQGGTMLWQEEDDDGNKKFRDDGTELKSCYLALAIDKNNPELGPFYQRFMEALRSEYGDAAFDAQGNPNLQRYSIKWQDGDGKSPKGEDVSTKEGFAGHWIVGFKGYQVPKCYYEGKFMAGQEIANPDEVIKKGYYIRIIGTAKGNGVNSRGEKGTKRGLNPGLLVTPQLVSLVGVCPPDEVAKFGGGPAASETLARRAPAYVPPGMMATPASAPSPGGPTGAAPQPGSSPTMPSGGPALPTPQTAAPALPTPQTAAPALPTPQTAGPSLAPQPDHNFVQNAGQQYTLVEAKAQGFTREQWHAAGYPDERLVAEGILIKNF
jgi:hypothetical protein